MEISGDERKSERQFIFKKIHKNKIHGIVSFDDGSIMKGVFRFDDKIIPEKGTVEYFQPTEDEFKEIKDSRLDVCVTDKDIRFRNNA